MKTYHDGHRELWNELAISGSDNKRTCKIWDNPEYKHLIKNDGVIMNLCFCCHVLEGKWDCIKCPITWQSNDDKTIHKCPCVLGLGSPYQNWCNLSISIKERKRLAGEIRDLHWVDKN